MAVAADSAVTIGRAKVHLTANKLFRLCSKAPIGFMVYGNAEAFGVPWEIIAKQYRRYNRTSSFSTVSEVFDDFVRFACESGYLDNNSKKMDVYTIVEEVCRIINIKSNNRSENNKRARANSAAEELLGEIKDKELIRDPIKFSRHIFYEEYGGDIDDLCDQIINIESPSSSLKKCVRKCVYEFIVRSYKSQLSSGIVVFGYGNSEIFPAIVQATMDGAPGGFVRMFDKSISGVDKLTGAGVFTFAQDDAAQLFMRDISSDLFQLISKSYIDAALRFYASNVLPELTRLGASKTDTDQIRDQFVDAFGPIRPELDKQIHRDITTPIIRSVEYLSKEDLATLAESLIEVTGLKRRVSIDLESVGGPIDVAVISKADGFVWIKRKHYFDIERNHQFLQDYDNIPQSEDGP